MSEMLFHRLSREEITELAQSGCPVIVPLAATEQHGPHLPVFTDSLICEHVCLEAARIANETTPMLVTPTVTIGCSEHHLAFGGTLSFKSATYLSMLQDIGESLIACGFRKIIFLNGHGGNESVMHQTATDIAVKHSVWTASASYWSVAREALQKIDADEVGMVPGHAGGFETALITALRPEWVRTERIGTEHPQTPWIANGIPGAFIGKSGMLTGFDGYTDAAHMATAEKGTKYLNTIIEALAAWFITVASTMNTGGSHERIGE